MTMNAHEGHSQVFGTKRAPPIGPNMPKGEEKREEFAPGSLNMPKRSNEESKKSCQSRSALGLYTLTRCKETLVLHPRRRARLLESLRLFRPWHAWGDAWWEANGTQIAEVQPGRAKKAVRPKPLHS